MTGVGGCAEKLFDRILIDCETGADFAYLLERKGCTWPINVEIEGTISLGAARHLFSLAAVLAVDRPIQHLIMVMLSLSGAGASPHLCRRGKFSSDTSTMIFI
jgi:hypothetical protein